MLLPSDVARLVLGYLQEEGLSSTFQSFIHESPNLKEYAEHSTEDGTIPACVFSLFGNGLTIILNEYVATKTKESAHEVPAMMTSLWKKLDFTLNQIRSLQNSPSISAIQRTRSRVGVANMARQRVLTVTSAGSSVLCSSVSEARSIISPSNISHSMLGHSTPVSYSTTHTRPAAGGGTHQQIQDAPCLLDDGNGTPPGREGGAQSSSSTLAVGTPNAEPQTEEAADENFPPSQQIVIQNARDKILGDRSLQEKLAENINKILGNEPPPQTSKAPSSTVEVDQSIDEILGLQGEIHMSDDAIHDILEQTESDPAFHALFELFDYNKTRFAAGDQGDGDISSNPGESNAAGPSSTVGLLLSYDPDTALRDANASDSATVKTRIGPERKTRKSSAPTLLKKVLGPSGRTSRIENSSARLLVSLGGHAGDSNRKQNPRPFQNTVFGTPMDIDEALHTPPPPSDIMDTAIATVSTILPSAAFALALPEATANRNQEHKQAEGSIVQPAIAPSGFLFPLQVELNNTPTSNANLPHTSLSSGVKGDSCTPSSSGVTVTTSLLSLASTAATSTSHSTSAALTAALPSLLPVIPTSSCTPTTPSKAAADTSNIVSLEIIISDNQDEDSSKGTATNHALPSIPGNKIPTIYLSSPVKSLRCPGTPRAALDEAALAVCGLQNSEAHGSPLGCKAVVVSPLRGTSLAQPNYIFQLPLDAANPELQGAATSYFILTEAPTADSPNRPVLLPAGASVGQPLPNNPFGVTIPTRSRGFSTVPTLILPSPAKPMILPVTVMGPNSLGTVQVVSNQLVAIQNPVPVQQSEKPSSPTVALKQSIPAGTGNLVGTSVPLGLALSTVQQEAEKASTHRRILCFDSSAEAQQLTAKTTRSSKKQREKDNTQSVTRTKPSILSGNKPKRRIETVRCSADPQTAEAFMKEAEKPTPPQQKDPPTKISRKQDHSVQNQETQSASTSVVEASQTEKSSESARSSKNRKHSHDKEGDGAKAKESRTSRSSSRTRKEKEDSSRKEPTEKASGKAREGRSEKKTPSQEIPNVTANKENEMKGSVKEQPSSSTLRDPPAAPQPASQPQPKASKAPSKTSSLAKQAAEMLQDIQGLNSPSTPGKRPGAASTELPRTPGHTQEESADRPWTPSRLRKGRDGEGTPKHLLPPNTPDVPTCSPASEAGSENSINMAAHTLMILSRAAIARTGTPLKDSLRQEEVGEHSPASSKISKKRKLSSPTSSPQAKKETKQSPSKTTEREKKKLVDCFPLDLDVDKFLSSLHYDE
ncbi:hypothetical protein CesoFtcFv8_005963 [Champsocephalus esox]|uniref:Protein NPAT C-terminal domain-containing protein n=1 Tax=Champsocephalus esox TaxID=159716 RepID=A0AAN8CIE0_9TELE|nr:hypothetical protein CesoFtcFv8_005963 [Champsocephalus esox]